MLRKTFFSRFHPGRSLLVKLVAVYSAIIMFILIILVLLTVSNFSDILRQKELSFEQQITIRMLDYADNSIAASREVVQQIYLSGKDTRNSVFSFIEGTEEKDSFEYYSQRDQFDMLFSIPLIKDNNILDIIFYKRKTGETLSYSRNIRKINKEYNFLQYPWFTDAVEKGENLRIVPSYQPEYVIGDKKYVYSATASIFNSFNKTIGLIVINMDTKRIEDSYKEFKDHIKGFLLVMDDTGNVIFDSSNRYYGMKYPYFNKLKASDDYILLDESCLVAVAHSQKNNLIAAGIIPEAEVMRSIYNIIRTVLLILLICMGLSFILIYFASYTFSHRIKTVINAMKEVEKGNLKIRITPGRSEDEIQKISLTFNKMCERLESYIEKAFISEIRTKDAELAALQAQINPHFLYNTLESIRMKAILNKDDDVGDMIYALGNLFKASIKNRKAVIRIKDEVRYTLSYLRLMQIRYHEKLHIQFDINENILNYGIPRLSIQPIAENCIVHGGLGSERDSITILVKGYELAGRIKIIIEDNGRGIADEAMSRIIESLENENYIEEAGNAEEAGNVGLRNIHQRIGILFGKEYGIRLESKADSGTSITMELPLIEIEEAKHNV